MNKRLSILNHQIFAFVASTQWHIQNSGDSDNLGEYPPSIDLLPHWADIIIIALNFPEVG